MSAHALTCVVCFMAEAEKAVHVANRKSCCGKRFGSTFESNAWTQ